MGINSKRKGAAGERECLAELSDALGIGLARNLSQTRDGGADCLDVSPFAIEVKRAERFRMAWIEQAEKQAIEANRLPLLAFRCNRTKWRYMPILTAQQAAMVVRAMQA